MEPTPQEEKIHTNTKIKTVGEALSVRTHKVATIGLFTLLAALLIGLYFWITAEKQIPTAPIPSRPTYETNREPESTTARAQVESLGILSTSDELTAIEADLESTALDNLDSDLVQINQELGASFQME